MQKENRDRENTPWPENAGSRNTAASEPDLLDDFLRMMEWIRQAQADAERVGGHAGQTRDDSKK